jgi:hypothetical protein
MPRIRKKKAIGAYSNFPNSRLLRRNLVDQEGMKGIVC